MQGKTILGKITGLHGVDGALSIHWTESTPNLEKVEKIYLDIDGCPTPFFISNYKGRGEIVYLEGIKSPVMAKRFVGCQIHIISEIKEEKEASYDIIGFEVQDQKGKILGTVDAVREYPGQKMLQIKHENRELLLPLHPHLLLSVDHKKKHITYKIPDGLLEI